MTETTARERREIAEEVNGNRSKSGKTLRPAYIETPEQLVEQYREYARRELMLRYEKDGTDPRTAKMVADMYAELSASQLEHDMPALIFFFRRMLTQR
jgi:hypothetical protein